ncbi:hypothetical protein [Microcoleus vaginatus]|uniref:hypothetical protein n=1 Tax=Microcoleus vaginatus TaxID=119532 RepID=UPI0016887C34|nr:hypothetical protein [Microcoleus sp. FACHB-84]MBD2011244.1 hypothetical protein [Microcoleus sp. FACHB-45]
MARFPLRRVTKEGYAPTLKERTYEHQPTALPGGIPVGIGRLIQYDCTDTFDERELGAAFKT